MFPSHIAHPLGTSVESPYHNIITPIGTCALSTLSTVSVPDPKSKLEFWVYIFPEPEVRFNPNAPVDIVPCLIVISSMLTLPVPAVIVVLLEDVIFTLADDDN